MIEYVLIKNDKYRIILLLEEKEIDYYTYVCVELIWNENKLVLFKDNLLALKNIIEGYSKFDYSLDEALDEKKLGLLINEYYRYLYEDDKHINITFENNGQWIGLKYCFFENLYSVTWVYKYRGDIIIRVTPVFGDFKEDEYIENYRKFVDNYRDIFREIVTLQELRKMKVIVLKLYEEYFSH